MQWIFSASHTQVIFLYIWFHHLLLVRDWDISIKAVKNETKSFTSDQCNKCKHIFEHWNVYNHKKKGINHIKWTTFDVNYFKVKIINIYLREKFSSNIP